MFERTHLIWIQHHKNRSLRRGSSWAVFLLSCLICSLKLWTKKWVKETGEFWKSQILHEVVFFFFQFNRLKTKLTFHKTEMKTHLFLYLSHDMATFLKKKRNYCRRRKPRLNHIKWLNGKNRQCAIVFCRIFFKYRFYFVQSYNGNQILAKLCHVFSFLLIICSQSCKFILNKWFGIFSLWLSI